MDMKGGLATSYGDLKRYLLTPVTKPNSPLNGMLPMSCGTLVVNAGQ